MQPEISTYVIANGIDVLAIYFQSNEVPLQYNIKAIKI